MHNEHEILGAIIKSAREKKHMTVEDLAAQVGITERYLYRIENENKKPRYEVLYKLIRTLSIHADTIFYPEKSKIDSEMGEMLRLLCSCDPRFRDVAKAMLRALRG